MCLFKENIGFLVVAVPDRKCVITLVLLSFIMLHGPQFIATEETDQKIVTELNRPTSLSPTDRAQSMDNKPTGVVHTHGHRRKIRLDGATTTMTDISRIFVSQNTDRISWTPVSKSPLLSEKTHFPTFLSYSKSPDIPEWLLSTKLTKTALFTTKLVPSHSVSHTYNPSTHRLSPSIKPSVRSKSPVHPTMPTMPSMLTASLTPSPTPPTIVTPPNPGVVTSKVVTGSSVPEKHILKQGFRTIEALLLVIIVLIAAIAGSLSAWFLFKLRGSQKKRSTKEYVAFGVGHI